MKGLQGFQKNLGPLLLGLGAVLIGGLMTVSGLLYASVRSGMQLLHGAEQQPFIYALTETARRSSDIPSSGQLAAMLRDRSREGLRYVGLLNRDGTPLAEAGQRCPQEIRAQRPPPGKVLPDSTVCEGRLRTVLPHFPLPPPNRAERHGPRSGRPHGPPPEHLGSPAEAQPPQDPDNQPAEPRPRRRGEDPDPDREAPRPEGPPDQLLAALSDPVQPQPRPGFETDPGQRRFIPFLVLEYEPRLARRLLVNARMVLLTGIGGSVFIAVALYVLGRLLRRQQAAQAELAQHRRLSALGEMSATLAHELRNPLASAKGHTQLLLESLETGTRPHHKAQRVVQEMVRLETLISDLLEFVRLGRVKRELVDLKAVLQASAELVDPVRIVLEPAQPAPATWSLDAERMQQVFVNLFRNSLQWAPRETLVTVSLGTEHDRLVVCVRDRGPGIDAAVLDRLFEPFVTTQLHGLGLGLAVCRQIIEAHGGTIQASNPPEGGAEFRLEIPAG